MHGRRTVQFVRESTIPIAREALFAWHERPGAFERLSPPWQRVEVVHSDGRLTDGAEVELRVWLPPGLPVGVPTRWRLVHRDYSAGWQFRDVQVTGPFARWSHLHQFTDVVLSDGAPGGMSTLRDAVDYALPFGFVGALGGGWVARRSLDRLFRYRHAVTTGDLERHAAAGLPPMTVAVTGASGLIGRALTHFLTTGGHTVVRIGRGSVDERSGPGLRDVQWDPAAGRLDPAALEGVDAVVHLAGASVNARWTPRRRRAILESRIQGTRLLAETLAQLTRPPRVLVSASAIGFYGDRGDDVLDETAPRGAGFLAEVTAAWEDAADPARAAGIRVVHPRLGVVLSARGGALPKLTLPMQLGAGGPIGGGEQWWSVVALDDVLGAVLAMLADASLVGAVNVVLPEPVRNAEFARTLGRVLRRPAVLPTPALAVRLALGWEAADELLLASQRVVPARLLASEFRFRHAPLERALRFEMGR